LRKHAEDAAVPPADAAGAGLPCLYGALIVSGSSLLVGSGQAVTSGSQALDSEVALSWVISSNVITIQATFANHFGWAGIGMIVYLLTA
jgi:hypothetical protein